MSALPALHGVMGLIALAYAMYRYRKPWHWVADGFGLLLATVTLALFIAHMRGGAW